MLPQPTDALPVTSRPLEDVLLLPEDAVLSSEPLGGRDQKNEQGDDPGR